MDPQVFSFIRSEDNPTVALTKGILPEQLEKWSQGPQFLRKLQEESPKFEENAVKINEEFSAEMKPPLKPDRRELKHGTIPQILQALPRNKQ